MIQIYLKTPIEVRFEEGVSEFVKYVACSFYNTYMLMESKILYSCGDNRYRQCGDFYSGSPNTINHIYNILCI